LKRLKTSTAITAVLVFVCAFLCWKVSILEYRLDHSGMWFTDDTGIWREATLTERASTNWCYAREVELLALENQRILRD